MQYYIKGKYYSLDRREKSMGIILNIQLSAFINHRIEPNANNISNLMNELNLLKLKEFLPNITTGQTIDLVKGRIDTISNLAFVTADKSGQIICQDERIDCIFNFNQDDKCDFESELQKLEKILLLIMSEYKIVSNRFALNINLLSEPYFGELQNTIFGKSVVSSLKFYDNREFKEWSMRENSWYPITISNEEDTLNVITELSMVTNDQQNEKRILCHMDINTIPENSGYRFNTDSLNDFVIETGVIAKEIKANFEELSNNVE